jgi:hypothetical protein
MTVAVHTAARPTSFVVDGITLLAVVLFIPFAILAIGLPLAFLVRLVVWLTRLI